MHDDGQSIHLFAGHEDVQFRHRRFPVACEVVVQRGITTGNGFQPIVEVEHDLVEWQLILQHDAGRAHILEALLLTTLVFHQFQNSAHVLLAGQDGGKDDWLFDLGNFALVGPFGGIVHFDVRAVGLGDFVTYAGGGRDQVQIELAFQTLLDNFHVQKTQKATAEAEPQGGGTFRLEEEGGIVQAQFLQRFTQLDVLVSIHRVETGEHHGLDLFEARQWLDGRIFVVGNGVADLGVRDVLDVGEKKSHLASVQGVHFHRLGREHSESLDFENPAIGPQANFLSLAQPAFEYARKHHHAAVGIEPGIENQCLQLVLGVSFGRGYPLPNSFQHLGNALPGFCTDQKSIGGIEDRKSTRLNSSHVAISYAV